MLSEVFYDLITAKKSDASLWLVGQHKTRADALCRRRERCVLTVAPQTHQTTVIILSHKIKTQKNETNSNFAAVLMKCAICEKTQ